MPPSTVNNKKPKKGRRKKNKKGEDYMGSMMIDGA
jgi:hypothetical protein